MLKISIGDLKAVLEQAIENTDATDDSFVQFGLFGLIHITSDGIEPIAAIDCETLEVKDARRLKIC